MRPVPAMKAHCLSCLVYSRERVGFPKLSTHWTIPWFARKYNLTVEKTGIVHALGIPHGLAGVDLSSHGDIHGVIPSQYPVQFVLLPCQMYS